MKKPLGDYVEGRIVHGVNEPHCFGYILWLLNPLYGSMY
jgi:hypothetical protein